LAFYPLKALKLISFSLLVSTLRTGISPISEVPKGTQEANQYKSKADHIHTVGTLGLEWRQELYQSQQMDDHQSEPGVLASQ
jgi:hypothetical protein